MATDKETIESLRNEIDYLKSKNQQMLMMMRKSEAEGKGAATSSTSSTSSMGSMGSMSGMNGGKGEEGKGGELDVSSQDILTKNVCFFWERVRRRSICGACFLIICARAIAVRGGGEADG